MEIMREKLNDNISWMQISTATDLAGKTTNFAQCSRFCWFADFLFRVYYF